MDQEDQIKTDFSDTDEAREKTPEHDDASHNGLLIRLPLLVMRGIVLLPHLNLTFDVVRERNKDALDIALEKDMLIFASAQKDPDPEFPEGEQVFGVGCVAKVRQVVELNENGVLRVTLEGLYRARLAQTAVIPDGELIVEVEAYTDILPDGERARIILEAKRRAVIEAFNSYLMETNRQGEAALNAMTEELDPSALSDKIASQLYTSFGDKQAFLEEQDVTARIMTLLTKLHQEIFLAQYGKQLNQKVSQAIDKNQKEYFLREQIKVFNEELGHTEDNQSAADEYREKLKQAKMSESSKEKLTKEIDKLSIYAPQNPETAVLRNYLDTVFELPWGKLNELHYDIPKIRQRLDKDHYGLEKVKERIMEFIAVEKLRRLKGETGSKGPILCLVGPPGVGKTSIASSIAAAMGRDFVRMSLGGVRDEAEIRGHRRTYIGALPGRIINALIQAGSDNPLILMDEIDKLAADYKGDPSSALLEVLDPEQNNSFRDHYLELPYDLSNVLFITTANRSDQIPPALYDRMEVIELNGYTVPEKYEIAKRHLLPKQMKQNALAPGQLSIMKPAMLELISNYTAEAGVRQLERIIAKTCRKAALEIATDVHLDEDAGAPEPESEEDEAALEQKIKVSVKNLVKYAGKPRYHYDKAGRKAISGLVRGLAWTAAGGDTLEIEAITMPGKGRLSITGQLGDVMKESCQVALAYVRAQCGRYDVEDDFFEKHDIHVHVPEGATPKDGPSAGITLVTALMSAVTKRKVDPSLAMTGEVTLRGRVLAIGGLKEKLIAADRAQIKTVIIPEENRRDIDDVPESVRSKLEIHFVSDAQEVLDLAL